MKAFHFLNGLNKIFLIKTFDYILTYEAAFAAKNDIAIISNF